MPDLRESEPFEKIEAEDVLSPRVVRNAQDVVVVLDNPREGRVHYPNDNLLREGEAPNFAVTARKGFQCYLETTVSENPNDPDGEPVFHGTTSHYKHPMPEYQIRVKL